MSGCVYSLELIVTEHITENNFFWDKHTIAEKSAQTMEDCKISSQNKYIILMNE